MTKLTMVQEFLVHVGGRGEIFTKEDIGRGRVTY